MGQLQTLEKAVREHVEVTKRAQSELERQKLELEQNSDDGGDDDAQQELAMKEIEEQSRLLQADQISSGVTFSQVHSRLTGHDIPPKPASTVPFRRDLDFVDRGDILSRIEEGCSQPAGRVALVGLGGVG